MTDLKLAAQKALEAARPYVEDASQRGYDGTNGTGIRAEAKRKLAMIDVALSALQHQEEREPVAWAIESNVGQGLPRMLTSVHLEEAAADKWARAEQAHYAGAERVKVPLYAAPPLLGASALSDDAAQDVERRRGASLD